MSCVTWHLPPPPLGPGPDQQGVCVAVCVRLKRLRGGGKVVMYVYMLGCSVSPLPHSPHSPPPAPPRFFLSLRRQQHRAASGQKRRGSGSNIRPQEGSGGENEGKRFILFI